jgi:hypothetical protein
MKQRRKRWGTLKFICGKGNPRAQRGIAVPRENPKTLKVIWLTEFACGE